MRRFFVPKNAVQGKSVVVSGTEAHHLRSVLRLHPGDAIELFDGTGTLYHVELCTFTKKTVEGRIISRHREVKSDLFPLTLAMAILKGKKMDLIVQKATELGVTTLIPTVNRYCESPNRNSDRRLERWQRIVLESCKQCGRVSPMEIAPVQPLQDIQTTDFQYSILCWEDERQSMITPDFFSQSGSIVLFVGPEGGFHKDEIHWAIENNISMTTLGSQVLRAETAAIAGVGIIQYLSGLQKNHL